MQIVTDTGTHDWSRPS